MCQMKRICVIMCGAVDFVYVNETHTPNTPTTVKCLWWALIWMCGFEPANLNCIQFIITHMWSDVSVCYISLVFACRSAWDWFMRAHKSLYIIYEWWHSMNYLHLHLHAVHSVLGQFLTNPLEWCHLEFSQEMPANRPYQSYLPIQYSPLSPFYLFVDSLFLSH